MNGILALWKEKGMTSHDCVFKLRKILKTKKIGHTGTLDPNVDGVLPICVGAATKMVEFMVASDKAYVGEITLGIATTTEDADGEIVATKPVLKAPSPEAIDAMMASMVGTLQQIPPMYSAVKVNGKRLYEYARANQSVERPIRSVTIHDFVRTSPLIFHDNQTVSWRFAVSCSKGTYIRTLAVDLGEKLGYPAHMSALRRTQSGGFGVEDCVTLAELEKLEDKASVLKPIEEAFLDYPRQEIDAHLWESVKNGAVLPQDKASTYPVFLTYQEKIVALYDQHPSKKGLIKPKKMFLTNYLEREDP